MSTQQVPTARAALRSWWVWLAAAFVYLLAVFHRSTFGVAGLQAAERFGVGPTALSTFAVLQVGVYAAMQVPTGVLVDRFGPRRVLTVALLLLGCGQILIAVVTSYPLGLLARAVLGVGDALTFVSVLRLTANHFPARQYTLLAALTGTLGFLGNLLATVPLAVVLDGPGWTATFLFVGVLTVVYVALLRWWVRDTRPDAPPRPPAEPISPRAVAGEIAAAWRVPGTRLGFWTHVATMSGPTVLALLWGVPFLVEAHGLDTTTASGVLMVLVFGAMFGGPLLGAVIGARPELRMPIVLGYLAAAGAAWAVLLAWPGGPALALLVACFAVLSLGAPAAMIGFALARDYNPFGRVGTATGVVNMGGFSATTIAVLAIGLLLEATGGNYRLALLSLVAIIAWAGFRMLVWLLRARAAVFAAEERGEQVPVRLRRHVWDRRRSP